MTASELDRQNSSQPSLALFAAPLREAAPEAGPVASEEHDDWLRLAFVGLPAGRCRGVLERWQSPSRLMEAVRSEREAEILATPGVTPNTLERLRQAVGLDLAGPRAAMERFAVRLLLDTAADYPAALRAIPDPPPYLFVRGTILACDEISVAIVGTRHATEYGRGVAAKLATELAHAGVTVTSGLARGIDTAAHRGALDAGGRSYAVCGCGLDIVYPSDNKALMADIEANGAAFSEFAPTVQPEAWHFPARNRIISGLSAGVIVVEAGVRSGALITADFALEQNRDVFAVPGNIHKLQSRGTHGLIKQGATLIESAEDVINALNNRSLPFEVSQARLSLREPGTPRAPSLRADLTAVENRVYLVLDTEPRHVDDLAAAAAMSAAQVNATLVVLELKGAARRLPGGMFALAT